ncbi:glycosyltransferase family 2 protein [Phnomibacter ginsenosidimutans]|uniref:Glycosyltransferase n=1 Tax=Phnomibacter ginsenosidimutans TaxID=2676868 RepID=A0A6I6GBB3_9BACT|nr:glycosyltransferase family 2 protein [Phnomibacter ginsenosidimutans]QGW29724.1 glycosyltransferase [Phnomibacter ginsenosidimutans]
MTESKASIPIVVLTPTKNEAWIIKYFLEATLNFAHHIIIADQNSTDETVSICNEYSNVTVIKNESDKYDEAYRQMLLLDTARKMFPGDKIIFALDADEIISADSIDAAAWIDLKKQKPGTVFYFEKPELYINTTQTIRYYHRYYPLAFIDDDTISHHPKAVHSIRIPTSIAQPKVEIDTIKFLHVAYLRPKTQRAKYRFYAVQENMLNTSPWYRRRRRYRNGNHLLHWEVVENAPNEWFKYESQIKIDLSEISDPEISWYDLAIKEAFEKYGTRKFWLDDIWDQEWQTIFKSSPRIKNPPKFLTSLLKFTDKFNK